MIAIIGWVKYTVWGCSGLVENKWLRNIFCALSVRNQQKDREHRYTKADESYDAERKQSRSEPFPAFFLSLVFWLIELQSSFAIRFRFIDVSQSVDWCVSRRVNENFQHFQSVAIQDGTLSLITFPPVCSNHVVIFKTNFILLMESKTSLKKIIWLF